MIILVTSADLECDLVRCTVSDSSEKRRKLTGDDHPSSLDKPVRVSIVGDVGLDAETCGPRAAMRERAGTRE